MNKLISLLKRAPKRTAAALLMLAVAIIVPASLFAWGPDRPTYTYEHPADHVTFNSITDNPNVGDERNFVRIREDVAGTTYTDNVDLQVGHTYNVEVYYHNNATSSLNGTNYDGPGVAHDVSLRMEVPGTVNAGATANINGFISASNATPGTVYDSAYAKNTSAGAIALSYVPGSAVVTSNGAVNGAVMPNNMFTTGAPLGYDSLNGVLPGCNQYAGYVVFKLKVDQPNFTVVKQVSVDGGKTWNTSATANAGDTIQYRVIYTNTGTTQQDNVTLSDVLPKNVSYVNGSALIANSVTGGKYQSTSDGITTTGLNIGSYASNGGNAYFKFSAKIADEAALTCGTNTLVNTARATTSGGYKEATATVTVNKTCQPNTANACNLDTKQIQTVDVSQIDDIHFTKDLSRCETPTTPPTTPPELPHTGPSGTVASVFGVGSLVLSLSYYIASRRAALK